MNGQIEMSRFANWHPLFWYKFALSRCKVVHQSLFLLICLGLPLLSLLLRMREKTPEPLSPSIFFYHENIVIRLMLM